MFHPAGHPMERGWVGRIEGDEVIHLAAQTLQSFFSGGGSAREHAVYPLAEVTLLAPVLHPPSVRVFDDQDSFAFANPASIVGPGAEIVLPSLDDWLPLELQPRHAAVIGAEGAIGGLTVCADWRAPDLPPPKDRDFALALGPFVVTFDDLPQASGVAARVEGGEVLRTQVGGFDWEAARDLAARGTTLVPGDVIVGPDFGTVPGIEPGTAIEIEVDGFGVLSQSVQALVELG
jgi:2-keto-4-pentenoate hydratase/2-oxohepta-3-ene-1,7-dioic acid hydratase in catechol pathway